MSPWPLLAALATSVLAEPAPAPPSWEPATKEERAYHAKLLRRFSEYAPGEPVEEALRSLSEVVTIDMGCKKAISVRTQLMKWRKDTGEKDGWYEWGGGGNDLAQKAGVETESFVNVLAFDAARLAEDDARSLRHKVDHTATFYHELLHAQLLIKAMKGDAVWRKAYCDKSDFDLKPADLDDPHKVIPDLEKAYADGLWQKVKDKKSWD